MFQVYVLLDPRKPGLYEYGQYTFDFEPFYVGKGLPGRELAHVSRVKKLLRDNTKDEFRNNRWKINKIKAIINKGLDVIFCILHRSKNENRSFSLEKKVIKTIGRSPEGPLCNISSGGEGASGYNRVHSEETILLNSKSNKETWANKTDSEKKVISEKLKASKKKQSKASKRRSALIANKASQNISPEKMAARNQKLAEHRRKEWESKSISERNVQNCFRGLGHLLKTLKFRSLKKKELFKEYVKAKITNYYSKSKHEKYTWSHVKQKVLLSYEKFLSGAIVL